MDVMNLNRVKEFNTFYFESFSFDTKTLQATFCYSFDEEEFFEEEIDFNNGSSHLLDENAMSTFLFQIHIALGISYYKLFPTSELIIRS
jgi:nitrate reductase gamma subunit